MKRFTSLLLASILAILAIASLASCGGNFYALIAAA